jgi:DNA-binding NarL/FixJ family response regulator
MRVVLADDHTLVRAGIRALLRGLAGVEVLAETGDGREAVSLVKLHEPDVVLMDIGMPGLNGLDATALIVKRHPGVAVIILSMHATEAYVFEALRAGATGYVLKDAAEEELGLALHAVERGERYLSPRVSKFVIDDYLRRAGGDVAPNPKTPHMEPLTTRQREILQLVAEGRTTRQIAERLHISVKTVETHRTQIMARLNVHDVAGLTRYAIGIGLVVPDA